MLSNSAKSFWKVLSLRDVLLLMLLVELSYSTSPCHIRLDMVVAVDTSSSCTQAEFTQLLSQVKALVSWFPIGPRKTRLALIGMSQSAQPRATFNDVSSLSDFNSVVDRLRLTSGRTEISKGMKLARNVYMFSTARKAPVPKLVVLVKDRRCSDRAMGSSDSELALIKSEANAVRSMEGTVHAVGIGGLWSSQELTALFGSKYVLFKNRNKAMESIKSLNNKLCLSTICKHSGQSVKLGLCFGMQRHVFTANFAGALNSAGAGVCRQQIARSFQSCTEENSCYKMERSLGSCQADGNLTIVDTLKFFNPKTLLCETVVDKHKVECSRARECERQVADVIIMLDRSKSLKTKYGTLVDATVELVKALPIGDKHVHIGVVSFSDTYPGGIYRPLKTAVKLGEDFNKIDITRKVLEMKNEQDFGGTFTGAAFRTVEATLRLRGRSDVSQAVILITDGQSDDPQAVFQYVSFLKKYSVTIYAIGVEPEQGSLNKDELKMITSPESDKNLFILENLEQLKPWAEKFSMTLCMELKPPNPKLCEAEVVIYSTSACVNSKMQTFWAIFEFDSARKCTKKITRHIYHQCKGTCVDPVDGRSHMEGDSWTKFCHDFRCDRAGKTTIPTKTTKCKAADHRCMAIGSAPFQCRNIDGEVREHCRCVDKGGEAVLMVDNPN